MQDPRFSPLVLHRLPDVGAVTYTRLLEHFGRAELALAQPIAELEALLKPTTLAAIADFQQHQQDSALGQTVIADLQWLDAQANTHVISLENSDYPALLRHIPNPPPLLFVRGNVNCLSLPQIAIVGSRNPSSGGSENAQRFAHYLAAQGFAITSGLALGVDALAHQGALAAKGNTVAVMGTGIDLIYPSRHRALAQQIVESGGALVSEFPLGTRSHAAHFPQRNRIISGLSCGVLVVEAAIQSGSLITASLALQQNRELFAIPGSIHNPLARGCHQLIRQGATLVETAQDIVAQLEAMLSYQYQTLVSEQKAPRELKVSSTQKMASSHKVSASKKAADAGKPAELQTQVALQDLSPSEQALVAALGFDAISMDDLIERTGLSIGSLTAQLVGLEVKGVVQQTGAGYQRA